MHIVGKKRKYEGLRYCSQHITRNETFMIPWINMEKEQKETEASIEVLVKEKKDANPITVVTPESFTFDCCIDDEEIDDEETESLQEVSRVLLL